MSKTTKHIILGVTGSIAAYKAGDIIRRLQENNCRVTVAMTRAAGNFITPLTLTCLSGEKIYQDIYSESDNQEQMRHIELAKQADALLIAPATANIIGKIANGLADDAVSCLALTTKAPIIIAPAMNEDMYSNAIVKENCQKLAKQGVKFIEPTEGLLACGVYGKGHLSDVETIVKEVQAVVNKA